MSGKENKTKKKIKALKPVDVVNMDVTELANRWVIDNFIKRDAMFQEAMKLDSARQPRVREYVA